MESQIISGGFFSLNLQIFEWMKQQITCIALSSRDKQIERWTWLLGERKYGNSQGRWNGQICISYQMKITQKSGHRCASLTCIIDYHWLSLIILIISGNLKEEKSMGYWLTHSLTQWQLERSRDASASKTTLILMVLWKFCHDEMRTSGKRGIW